MEIITDTTSSYVQAKQSLIFLNNRIKEEIEKDLKAKDCYLTPGHVEKGVGHINGEAVNRLILILRGNGCEWTNKEHGGCIMCGHSVGSTKGNCTDEKFLQKQFNSVFDYFNFYNYPLLCLYNGGSFLNEREISIEQRQYIFNKIEEDKNIKRLIIESRPEYLTKKVLDEIEGIFRNTIVEIGVGFETANNQIRNLILNKGISDDDLIKVGQNFANRRNIKLLAYILVKPPFLTPKEAIKDTIEAIYFAKNVGADIISLEAVSIQHLTTVSFLAEAGFYKPTWIWSLFEIVKQTFHLGIEIRIGGFEFYPLPIEYTSNCEVCNKKMIEIIQEFNMYQDINLIKEVDCLANCNEIWERELIEMNELDLPARIIKTLKNINIEETIKNLRTNMYI